MLGAAARPMTGYERLEALHSVFHPEGEPFRFSWDWLIPSGLTTKDFIAPSSFRFGEGRYFRMGRKIGAVSFLEILAPELNDRMLADILDLETGIVVNLHILFSSHILDVVEKLCNIISIIKDGRLLYSGTTEELIGVEGLEEAFMELNSNESFDPSIEK